MIRLFHSAILLLCMACSCRGEPVFIGILEADSLNSLEMSLHAFSEVARIPALRQLFRDKFAEIAALPQLEGFERDKRIRIIQTVDPDEPLSDKNPAYIAILPVRDSGEAVGRVLAASYASRSRWLSEIHLYANPGATNLADEVAAVHSGDYFLTSRSKTALLWACKNEKLLYAAPLRQEGAIRMLVNPQRLGAVLNAKLDPRLTDLFRPAEYLQELETCSAALAIEAQSLTLSVHAVPFEGGPLRTLLENLTRADTALLTAAPGDSFLQSIARCNDSATWNRFALNPAIQAIPALSALTGNELFTGERAHYLAPSPDKKGLMFVQIETVKEKPAVQKRLRELATNEQSQNNVYLEKSAAEPDSEIMRYKVRLNQEISREDEKTPLATVAALFLQHAWLEFQIVGDRLVTVIGPENAIRDVVGSLDTKKPDISLLREINARNGRIGRNLLSGSKVRLSALMRYVASTIPNITREQLAVLPDPGYGITLCLAKPDDKRLDASLQISADEAAALYRFGSDSRELMQRLLVAMLIERIEKTKMPQEKDAAD